MADDVALYVCFTHLTSLRRILTPITVRVFRPVLWLRLQDMLLRLRGLFMSRKRKLVMRDKWGDSISPVGQHPIETVVPYKTWASE